MSNYNPVYWSVWTSQKFTQLNPTEKLVYLYLLTNEKTQPSGIYSILLKHIACDCEIELSEVEKTIDRMSHLGMIKYWKDENLIYIHKFFRYSKGMIKNPKNLNGPLKRQRELLKNVEAWKLFDAEFENEISLLNEALMKLQTNKDRNGDNINN